MPAYRSEAEAEVREAVVAKLRKLRPDARIMHEVNASGFGNRIDVLAVSPAEIIAVEVKSARDKLDRLPDQLAAMRGCAHHAIAALHEKFLVEHPTSEAMSEYERDGVFYRPALPKAAPFGATWIYPEQRRCKAFDFGAWRELDLTVQTPLPPTAIDMLWREELRSMCHHFDLPAGPRTNMPELVALLRWSLTGRDLTRGICAALRARKCIEADDPIEWSAAA